MNTDILKKMYRTVAKTRAFNGAFAELKRAGEVPGPIHQTEGQEAVGVGIAAARRNAFGTACSRAAGVMWFFSLLPTTIYTL